MVNQWGINNHEWKGGTCRSTIRRICKRVLDNAKINQYICACCGKKSTIRHNIHHKDQNRLNNSIENLVVLCAKCHNYIHKELHENRRNKLNGRYS